MSRYNYFDFTENYGNVLHDFSVNTNPLGLPKGINHCMSGMTEWCQYYPDPKCKRLRELLTEKYYLPQENIFCGNGADELTYRILSSLHPRKALIVSPTFEEYERAANLIDCQVIHYLLQEENNFVFDENILDCITEDLDMFIFCNPNNPTGSVCPLPLVKKILVKCSEKEVTVIIDECFIEFLPDWKQYSSKQLINEYDNLIVIDAFTKIYSMAGFRLGFCISSNIIKLKRIAEYGQSFSVSIPAQIAGICALTDKKYLPDTYALLEKERTKLITELRKLPLKVFPTQANFLLFYSTNRMLTEELKEFHIKLRDCSAFYGLNALYHRIAIRTQEENQYLIQALKTCITTDF